MLVHFRRHLWIWPLLFALLLAGFGWLTLRSLETTMQSQVRNELLTTRQAAVAALEIWRKESMASVAVIGADPRIVDSIRSLTELVRTRGENTDALLKAAAAKRLSSILDHFTHDGEFEAWGVITASGYMLANENPDAVGSRPSEAPALLKLARKGKPIFTPPIQWHPEEEKGQPEIAMIAGVPIYDREKRLIALLGFTIDPDGDFSRILNVAQPGETGETYAFDSDGVLVSRSRFEDQLRKIGLIDSDPKATSALSIQIRAPGGDLTRGYKPTSSPLARPLTKMAASAISGEDGIDVAGYRDYRGVKVVGSWAWVPQLQLGVVTEMDYSEAFAALSTVRTRLLILIALLGLGALGMFGYSFVVIRLQGEVAEVKQLGRYTIERKLGRGGMGTVYSARHALLRRPTAVKVLDSDGSNAEAIARFEREVQVSSSLSHPNTIEIYDYGYTPDGTFYYAMELLRGITIGKCIEDDGPQPEARAVYIMRQICGSLAEAHSMGLIHRDLKPSNIMLCEIGGMLDFVKVLDFGLVRQQRQKEDLALTQVNALTGTPLYMSPEAVDSPDDMDARSDVYQLGAILYSMLTATDVFSGETPVEVLAKHIGEQPQSPSERLGRPISPDLEALALQALAKKPEERPADASALLDALERCAIKGQWGRREAKLWWATWNDQHPDSIEEGTQPTGTLPSGWDVDLHRRIEEA